MYVRRMLAGSVVLAVSALTEAAPATAAPIPPGGGAGVAGSEPVTLTLTLAGADRSQLPATVAAVTTPGGRSFRRHLTRAQVRERHGAPPEQVRRVSVWARRTGFRVTGLDDTGTRLRVTGTARTARAAFGVGLNATVERGVRIRSATGTPRPPASVARDVVAVTGLTQHVATPMHARPAATPMARDGQYCSTYWAEWNNTGVPQRYPAGQQSNQICGYTGPQLRALYGLSGSDTGAGQTLVIVGAYNSPTTLADANAAFAQNGVPPLPADRYRVTSYHTGSGDAAGCDQKGWHIEQALDVQAVHTIAPEASIVYAAAADCTRLEETLAAVIADPSVKSTIISNSWGILSEPADTAYLTATNAMLARAAILGIGTYVSSGDTGDNSTLPGASGTSVAYPASSPWTTAVGGTTAAIGANNQALWQTGWASAGNTLTAGGWQPLKPAFLEGAGGGPSARFDKPTWQHTIAGTRRSVPDVSALADPYTGFFIGTTLGGQYQTGPIGGTSLAAPIVAAMTAVAQSRAGSNTDVGLLAPVLYARRGALADVGHVAAGIWAPGVREDLPLGNYLLDVDAGVQTLKTTAGYDPVTGLGTPVPAFLTEIVN